MSPRAIIAQSRIVRSVRSGEGERLSSQRGAASSRNFERDSSSFATVLSVSMVSGSSLPRSCRRMPRARRPCGRPRSARPTASYVRASASRTEASISGWVTNLFSTVFAAKSRASRMVSFSPRVNAGSADPRRSLVRKSFECLQACVGGLRLQLSGGAPRQRFPRAAASAAAQSPSRLQAAASAAARSPSRLQPAASAGGRRPVRWQDVAALGSPRMACQVVDVAGAADERDRDQRGGGDRPLVAAWRNFRSRYPADVGPARSGRFSRCQLRTSSANSLAVA